MLYAQSEDSDDDNDVLLTDTYTTHYLSSHIRAALLYPTTINCLVLSACLQYLHSALTHTQGRVTVVLIKDSCHMIQQPPRRNSV
jgi:hypothetical protein